ncbi:MAG: cupin domain-containing protein [Actinomycetota bacterium]|nr:cupin domain-containing protein [Actinomycetota bacterium]
MTGQEALHVPAGGGKSLRIMGNRVEIKAASENTEDAFAVLEYRLAPETPGPPPHLHRRTDEAFYVLEGELTFHLDDRSIKAGPGAFVLVPHGVVHTFENAADSEVRFLEIVAPGTFAGYFEELVTALPAGGGPPDPATVTSLYERYDIVPAAAQANGR